jgi:hypothetical protein
MYRHNKKLAARRRRQSAKGKPDPMPRVFQPSSGNARTVRVIRI